MIKKIAGILFLFVFINVISVKAQMTSWQMDNFKKNDKSRQNKLKGKSSGKRVKKTRSNHVKTFKGGKTFFTRKKYKVAFLIDDPTYLLANRKREAFLS